MSKQLNFGNAQKAPHHSPGFPNMSSYHPLPTTNPQPSSSSATYPPFPGGVASQISSDPALLMFISSLTDSIRTAFARIRPLHELTNQAAFSRPMSLSDAITRLRKNASYFRANYLTIIAMVLAYSLVSHPWSLFTLVGLIAAWLLYIFRPSNKPVVIFNYALSEKETMWALILITFFAVFLTSVCSVLMSSMCVGVGIVCVHGAFRDPADLYVDEQEIAAGSGLFSLLGGAASSAAMASGRPGPNMVSRV